MGAPVLKKHVLYKKKLSRKNSIKFLILLFYFKLTKKTLSLKLMPILQRKNLENKHANQFQFPSLLQNITTQMQE